MNVNSLSKYMRNFGILIFLLLSSFLTACGAKDTMDNNVPVVAQDETQEEAAEGTKEGVNTGEAMEVEPSITPKIIDDTTSEQDGDAAQGNEVAIDRDAM